MFIVTFLCLSRPYTNLHVAEREIVRYLRTKQDILSAVSVDCRVISEFQTYISREQYRNAIDLWNEVIKNSWICGSQYLVDIVEHEVDQAFT